MTKNYEEMQSVKIQSRLLLQPGYPQHPLPPPGDTAECATFQTSLVSSSTLQKVPRKVKTFPQTLLHGKNPG